MLRKKSSLPTIGWREWVRLPELGIDRIKVKVDSGARSSSLHAFDLELFQKNGEEWVRFKVHPVQRKSTPVVDLEAKVLESRLVRSSSGKATKRPVIVTSVELLGVRWPVELTELVPAYLPYVPTDPQDPNRTVAYALTPESPLIRAAAYGLHGVSYFPETPLIGTAYGLRGEVSYFAVEESAEALLRWNNYLATRHGPPREEEWQDPNSIHGM